MAVVHSVCVSRRKGERKTPVDRVALVADHGIDGDAHAGSGRQVSLLSLDALERMRRKLPTLTPGDFAENFNVAGLETLPIALGRRLRLGRAVVLEVTAIGKTCHDAGCAIKKAAGTCVMPREGVFARVVVGGEVVPGDAVVAE
ncbi:MOSC domain-containing protein [Solidesulfovibrio sp.]